MQKRQSAKSIGTADDVRKLLDLDLDTIYRAARAGELPGIRVGRQWRFDLDEIRDRLRTSRGGVSTVSQTTNPVVRELTE